MLSKTSFMCGLIAAVLCAGPALAQNRRGGGGGQTAGGAGNRGLPPGAYAGAKFVEPLQRWEYGRLDIFTEGTSKDGVSKITWHGAATEKSEAASTLELIQKLVAADVLYTTAPTEIDDDLLLWNTLGDRGWEFISQETIETPGGATPKIRQIVIRFKRPKR